MKQQPELEIPTLQQQDKYLEKKRQGQGLDKNFKLFNDFLKLREAGFSKVTIMLLVSFFHQALSYIAQQGSLLYYDISTLQIYTIQQRVLCQIKFQVHVNMQTSSVYCELTQIFPLIFTIGLTLLYLIIFILGQEYKPRKKFIGKLFVFLCDIYIWLMFFPCMVTCFEFCICNQEQECNFDIVRIILTLLAIFGLICGLLNIIVLTALFHNNWEDKKDCFNGENVIYLSSYQFSRFIMAFFVVFSTKAYTFIWLFMIVSFLLYTFFLINILVGSGFLAFGTKYTRTLFIIMLIFLVSVTFSTIVDELHRSQNSDKSIENFSVYFAFTLIFLLLTVGYNLRHTQSLTIQFDIHSLSPDALQKQIYTTLAFLEVSLSDISIDTYFKGILQRHLDFECQHPEIKGEARCFCKKKRVFDSKKRKEVRVEEWFTMKAIIMKFLMKSWIETYLSDRPNDVGIQILYARFMFSKFHNHQIALHILSDLEKRFTFVLDRYKSYQLKWKIIKFIKHKNSDSYKGKLEIENALFVEEQIDSIKNNITNILKQNCVFWNNLQQTTIDMSEMDNLLQMQFKKIEETKHLWITITNYLEFKKKWKFYYAWFTLYVLNKKIKNRILDNFQGFQVNENDIFSEELQEHNDDVNSVKSGFLDNEKIEIKSRKIIFDKKACIIQASDDIQSSILKVNKQFTRIFGYSSEEVVRMFPINNLMPDVYSKVHPQILNDYKQTGKSNSLYSQRKIYCLHKSGFMFTAWKFLKLYVDLNGLSQFVIMVRPTDFDNEKKHDYIILNNDWEINGMTNNVLSGLNLDPRLFKKASSDFVLFNVLLFAPKLIQYSRIAPLINEERDLPIFGMMKNPKKPVQKKIHNQIVLENQLSNSSKPKINVNMLGSSSLKQSFGKPIQGMYSDLDFGSKVLLPQQSIDQQIPQQLVIQNERDKFLQHQMSSISDKNEFEDFNKQIGQFDKIQNLNQEMERRAEEQINQLKESQFQNNYQKIQTMGKQDKDAYSEDNASRDEMIEKIKGIKILEGKINGGEQIQFRMKIPENMDKIIEYYSSQKSKMYQLKKQQDEHVKQEEMVDQGKKKDKDKLFVKQGTQHREFRKKARLMFQKAAEMKRCQDDVNFYELLVEIYQKLIQEQKSRTFKVNCTIQFIKIKDERVGIIKIISINEIMKIKRVARERDGNRKQSFFLKNLQPSRDLVVKGSKLSATNIQNQFENSKFVSMASESDTKQQASPLEVKNNQKNPLLKDKSFKGNLGYQMNVPVQEMDDDKDLLIDSKAFNKMINWDTFQQQFKMQQGALNFSLNAGDNIFRKEDNNRPRKFLIKIAYLTWFLRIMFVAIITLNLLTYFLKPFLEFNPMISQANRILALSQMQTTMIETYDTLLDLLIYQDESDYNDMGMSDKLTYYNYQLSKVQESYDYIKLQIKDLDQLQTFLDDDIFYSSAISDESILGQANTTLTLDSKDFFTKFIMLEHQISMMNASSLEIISPSHPLVKFIRYVTIPQLYNQLNNAVMDLQSMVLEKSNSISDFVIIILSIEGSLLASGFFGLLIIIFWISQTYKAVLKIFILIQKNDLNKIVKQQKFIEHQFKYIIAKDQEIAGIQPKGVYQRVNSISSKQNFQLQQNFLLINEEEDQNMNKKKEKNIIDRQLLKSLTLKLYATYILLVLLQAGTSFAFFFSLKQASSNISQLIQIGQVSISDFSNNQLLLVSVKERYYNEDNYESNYLPKVKALLEIQIESIKQTPQIDNPGYGNYYDGFQAIYFDNLCDYLFNQSCKLIIYSLELNSTEQNDCGQLVNGKLKAGIVAFNQYFLSNVQDYVLLNADRFGFINSKIIWNLNSCVDYVKTAFKYLLTEWAQDLNQLIDSNITLILVLLIVMQLFQLIVFLAIAEMYLVDQLNKAFSFYRLVYKSYMPNDIIQKEKIIRAQLIRYNIIKK
ncbi:unnamed protein product (macronuclear) [Paramecium tetraurelia]|uniref:PAS domain-containing protein n=1 Tax=Paramecium tetraurelia TaxID=5888 RepID=A0BHZ4_PARTE|nr:uncharacterized protein GSPATT00029197001 [Paramecium tetraurelia]CAK58161.1 unnamed protein product [Paramecium tetraurelia]|eukprot:XP_001425559.1 hypothetical protein (macronuclear) [Paramecium tetraurelia strain d4-2]